MENIQQYEQELQKRITENLARIKHKLIVISGKGGVGKTSVAVNLSYALALAGNQVGLLDVDIHGPNVPKMLGISGQRLGGTEGQIEPVKVLPNLKVVSLGLVQSGEEQPIIWRGPLKMKAIRQLLGETNWGSLDFLIVDSPPGTGDEPLSVCQLIPDIDGAIIVTTPQEVAVMDGRKSVRFAQQLKVPVVGIIENMSGFVCPHCGKEIDLFGVGGGEKAAKDMDVPFLGRIPIEPKLVELEDRGKSTMEVLPDDNAAVKATREIVGRIAGALGES